MFFRYHDHKFPILSVFALSSEIQGAGDFRQALGKEGFFKMMSKEDRRILDRFAARVHERLPDARIWAFGSRVRGDATWDSDFDVFIVLEEVDQRSDRWIREIAWEVGFENDRVITTVLLDKEQFEHGPMSESTLVVNILREGLSA